MKYNWLILGSLVPVFWCASAEAADMLIMEEKAEPAYHWSGPYLGLHGAWLTAEQAAGEVQLIAEQGDQRGQATFLAGKSKRTQKKLGLYAGFNMMLGPFFVAGLEADFISGPRNRARDNAQHVVTTPEIKTADGTEVQFTPPLQAMALDERPNQVDYTTHSALRLRLGVGGERVLGYLAGGLGILHGNLVSSVQPSLYRSMVLQFPERTISQDVTRLTWTWGAGLEVALTERVLLRGEYRYTGLTAKKGLDSRYYERLQDPPGGEQQTQKITIQYPMEKSWNHDWRIGLAAKF